MKVNGKQIDINSTSAKTIIEYLAHIKIKPGTVAIELNGDILEREKWDNTQLSENDQIEIIKFVGGG